MENQGKPSIQDRMIRKESYHRLYEVRAAQEGEAERIIEGKAISFNDETLLFEWDGTEVYESISEHALDEADLSDVFLKYNHSDQLMVMARTKNRTLSIDIRPDGAYIRASLADTTAGRDLYELVKRGDIDKMSFAFTIKKESRSEEDNRVTYTVEKIDKLYDVAAVPVPAYENTNLYARRHDDLERLRAEEESRKSEELRLIRQKAALR